MQWLLALLLLLAVVVAAPSEWFWISTEPEPPGIDPAPFDFGGEPDPETLPSGPSRVDPRETVRVLRWGPDRGARHGPYMSFDEQGRPCVLGRYHRGGKVGEWTTLDASGATLSQGGYDEDSLQHGPWIESMDGIRVESERRHGELVRWRLEDAGGTPWIIPPSSFLTIGLDERVNSGVRIQSGLWMSDGDTDGWFAHGTTVSIGDSGRIDAIGPYFYGKKNGLWTYFDDRGEIEQQDFWEEGVIQLPEQKTEPPWYDLAACYDPSVPLSLEQSPDGSDVATSAAEDPGAPDPDEE